MDPSSPAPGCSILKVTFDCSDPETVARFWSGVTGWACSLQDMPDNPFWLVAPPGDALPRLVFVAVAEPKHGKNRLHLDLLPASGSSQDADVARVVSLGGRVVEDRRGELARRLGGDGRPGGQRAVPRGRRLIGRGGPALPRERFLGYS